MDMVDMDLAIGEGRGGLLKQSPLLKQIQRLKLILTIFMVDMVDLAIMDIVDLDIMDMADMDLAIGEERGDLLKQSPLLKQIQMLKLILTIFMVDMVDLAIMDIVDSDIMDMVDMDLAIGEERGGLLKQSPIPKQIQRLRQILTIFMVDMVDLDIMDIVDLDIMDMPDMVVIMDTENREVQQLIPKKQYCNNSNHKHTMLEFYNDNLFNLKGHALPHQSSKCCFSTNHDLAIISLQLQCIAF